MHAFARAPLVGERIPYLAERGAELGDGYPFALFFRLVQAVEGFDQRQRHILSPVSAPAAEGSD